MPLDLSSFPFRTANRQSKQSDFTSEYESGIYDYFKVRDLLNDSLIQVALCNGEVGRSDQRCQFLSCYITARSLHAAAHLVNIFPVMNSLFVSVLLYLQVNIVYRLPNAQCMQYILICQKVCVC